MITAYITICIEDDDASLMPSLILHVFKKRPAAKTFRSENQYNHYYIGLAKLKFKEQDMSDYNSFLALPNITKLNKRLAKIVDNIEYIVKTFDIPITRKGKEYLQFFRNGGREYLTAMHRFLRSDVYRLDSIHVVVM